jgi:toxin ParE1/3/4
MKPAVFHDKASTEFDEAAAWYERQRAGLGRQFEAAVEQAIRRICENPLVGACYRTTKVRYVLVRRFPYVVYCFERSDVIQITAVAHGRRRPGYWRQRSNDLS